MPLTVFRILNKCSLTKSTDQIIAADANWHDVTFDGENIDVGDMHNNSTNNQRITITKAGNYTLRYQVEVEIKDKMSFESRILKNGISPVDGTCYTAVGSKDASEACMNVIGPIITVVEDDYFIVQVRHDNGDVKNVIASNTYFAAKEDL